MCPMISFNFSIEPPAKTHWLANVCRVAWYPVKAEERMNEGGRPAFPLRVGHVA